MKKWNERLKSQNQNQNQSQSQSQSQNQSSRSTSSKSSTQSARSAKSGQPEKGPVCYMDEIIAFIKKHSQDSGIVYVLSRKEAGGVGEIE